MSVPNITSEAAGRPDVGSPPGDPAAGEAPKAGRMARASAAVRRARERIQEARTRWVEIAERERARRPSVAAAFSLSQRDRQQAGALLAGGLAFRFFLWLLPLALVVVCTLGAARDFAHVDPVEAARTGGVSAAVAASISDAVQGAGKAWWFLLPLALWLLFWAASTAARSMRLVSAVAWRVSPGKRASMVRAAAGFTGVVAGMIACSLLTRPLFAGAAATDVLAWLLALGGQAALAFWGLTTLPRPPEVRRLDLLPGAVLFVAGLAALRILGGWYFAHEIGKVSDLYGSLGLSVVFLTWLYLFGRLVVAGLMLNGVVSRQRTARAEAGTTTAGGEPGPTTP